MKNFFSESITLAAGEVSRPIAIPGTLVSIMPNAVDEYSTDLAVKLDDGGFRSIPTGTAWEPQNAAGDPAPFNQVQFKNTGAGSITFHALIGMGGFKNYNMVLNGEVSISQVTVDDTTPLKVEQQTSVDVLQSATVLALFNRMADALDAIETSNSNIDANTTP